MSSLRPVAAVIATLLIAGAASAQEVAEPLPDRLSIEHGDAVPPPGLTLLEPSWLLPPIESLEPLAGAANAPSGGPELREGISATAAPPGKPSGGPLSYSLSDHLSAQLRYRRSQGFDRSTSRALRDDPSTAFSTLPNRDVLDLNMSWDVSRSTALGLGYQLQSSAGGVWGAGDPEAGGVSRFLPGNDQATHSLMFGLTRHWGAPDPPPVIADMVLIDPVVAGTGTPGPTPTPAS